MSACNLDISCLPDSFIRLLIFENATLLEQPPLKLPRRQRATSNRGENEKNVYQFFSPLQSPRVSRSLGQSEPRSLSWGRRLSANQEPSNEAAVINLDLLVLN